MRLKKILIINRAPFEHFELDLGDENITLLSGINGSGKTTIISYIVDAFYELAKKCYINEFNKTDSKFYRISSGLFSLDSSKMSAVYLRFLQPDGNHVDYVDIRDVYSKEDYDSKVQIPGKIEYSTIERALRNNQVVKHWSISDKLGIDQLFTDNLLTYFPAYRYETPYYLNDPYKIKLNFNKDTTVSGYLTNPIEVTSDLPDIANWIMDVVLDQHVYQGVALSILFTELNDILTHILMNKVHCRTRVGIGQRFSGASRIGIMNSDDNKTLIYPSIFSMSSGELALLCLFVELLKQTDKNHKRISDVSGIVLIDEVDKHLHIKLQKEVLPTMFALFPHVQFITSSHSPFLGLGLAETDNITYKVYDLDNGGFPCPPQDNELFQEVYHMMISENDRYATKFKALQEQTKNYTKPLIITEGKTDWKHLKAAMEALDISDLDIDFYKFEDTLGDSTLMQLLKDYARINQPRMIIGIFDRDNSQKLKCDELKSQEYFTFHNNVFAFAIPLVNADEYGNEISIEHYYKRDDLLKEDSNGRRLFLGEEFYSSGISKDGKLHTRFKSIDSKAMNNGIVDEKVFDITVDREEQHSIALSKDDFAEMILKRDHFADGFDFSNFTKIFDVIRKIISENNRADYE